MPSPTTRPERWTDRHFMRISSALLVVLLLFFFFVDRMVITIPAGYGGALWLRYRVVA